MQKRICVCLCYRAMVAYFPFRHKMGYPTLLLPEGWLAAQVLIIPQATLGREGMLLLKQGGVLPPLPFR